MITSYRNINYDIAKPPVNSYINWGHSITNQLVGCWLFNEGAGKSKELVNGSYGTYYNDNGWISGRKGLTRNWNASTLIAYEATYLKKASTNLSFACGLRRGGTIANYAGPFQKVFQNFGAAPYNTYALYLNNGGAGQNLVTTSIGTTIGPYNSANIDVGDATKPFIASLTCSLGDSYYKTYINGILKDTVSPVSGGFFYDDTTSGKFTIGGGDSDGPGSWIGDIYFIYIWNRALQPAEHASISSFPYQFICKRKPNYYNNTIVGIPPVTTTGIMTPRSSFWGDL